MSVAVPASAQSTYGADVPIAVLRNAQCASACFLIFAAGKNKWASAEAHIGVHSASDSEGVETIAAKARTADMARVSAIVGLPNEIIGRMVATLLGQIAWLSRAELTSMGVHFLRADAGY